MHFFSSLFPALNEVLFVGEKMKRKWNHRKKKRRTRAVNIIARGRKTRGSGEDEDMDDEERRGNGLLWDLLVKNDLLNDL